MVMALFLGRSQVARVARHFSSSRLISTTLEMGIPKFGDPNKYLNGTEARNEKQRKVQQLAKDVLFLSCESTAKGGVCDIYVLGVLDRYPEPRISIQALQAIMSNLNPQVLFLQVPEGKSSVDILDRHIEFEKYSATDLLKVVMNKPISNFGALVAWSLKKYVQKLETSLSYVAYREAIKSGRTVVLGDRPEEVMRKRLKRKTSLYEGNYFDIYEEIMFDEQEKYLAHKLLEVAKKNSLVVAIVGKPHLEGINKYWKQPIEMEELMTIPIRRPTLCNMFLSWLGFP